MKIKIKSNQKESLTIIGWLYYASLWIWYISKLTNFESNHSSAVSIMMFFRSLYPDSKMLKYIYFIDNFVKKNKSLKNSMCKSSYYVCTTIYFSFHSPFCWWFFFSSLLFSLKNIRTHGRSKNKKTPRTNGMHVC